MKAHEFTRSEWKNFLSAERWPNGDRPLWRDFGDRFAIADRNGLSVFMPMNNPVIPFRVYVWNVEFPSQWLARLVLDALDPATTETQLQKAGFVG